MSKTVKVEVARVGQQYGCVAYLRDARTGRKVRSMETHAVPYGMDAVAYARGVALAEAQGWTVVS